MSFKPKMYQNKTDKEFNNNKIVYTSYNDNNTVVNNSNDVRKKINDIFNSSTFIYSTRVNIVIDNQVITKKVIGVYNNNLVTLDNEYIPIEKIKDIYK